MMARIIPVGEQPGDAEDRAGEPFVGPAGQLLRGALAEAGIDPSTVYLTNVVKHFKWTSAASAGSTRSPTAPRLRPAGLDEEIAYVKARAIIALGATAATELLGGSVRVTRDRGKALASLLADIVIVTVHPPAILRTPDRSARAAARRALVADLRSLAKLSQRRSRS